MSEFTNGQKGVELVKEEKWDEAIELLNKAIKVTRSPIWLLARAQAHQQKKDLDKALVDCEHAYLGALQRQSSNRTQQLSDAQYRRGVLYFKQGRYADADACFVWAMRLALDHPLREEDQVVKNVDENGDYKATVAQAQADKPAAPSEGEGMDLGKATKSSTWVRPYSFRVMALGAMDKLPKGAPGRKLTVTRTPTPPDLVNGEAAPAKKPIQATTTTAAASAAPTPATAPTMQKLRFDFFQSSTTVTLSIFVKNVNKDRLKVESASPQAIMLRNLPRESSPNALLGLSYEIVPSETKHKVFGTKIELTLTKASPGQKWGSWGSEVTAGDTLAQLASSLPATETITTTSRPKPEGSDENSKPTKASGPPSYPTSSKKGAQDWEKLGRDEETEESKDGQGDVNQFFQKLFKDSDPDTQRAMMKSFTESGGTSLTTNWADAKSRKFEVEPPEGVEAKKWDS